MKQQTLVHSNRLENADHDKRTAALSSVAAAIFLTTMKFVVGIITGSLGILSEAAHSGLDMVAAAVTYFAVRLSGKPADPEHTYGHGKIENISALFETLLLLATCVWIIYEAILRLFFKSVEIETSIWAFVIMAVSIGVDFSRSRLLKRVAEKYDSQALEADALHFSTDIWSSSVVIGGLFLVQLSKWLQIDWLAKADAVAALGVAGIVVYVSLQLGQKTVSDLLDAIPPGVRDNVTRAIQKVPGVHSIKHVRIRRSGPEVFADIRLTVTDLISLEQAHDIATAVEAVVHQMLPGSDVVVNVMPAPPTNDGITTIVRRLAARQGLGVHGIRMYDVLGNRSLEMHLEVSDTLRLEQAHDQATTLEEIIREAVPGIHRIVTHIEPVGEQSALRLATSEDEVKLREVLQSLPEITGILYDAHDVQVNRVEGELSVSFHCYSSGDTPITNVHALTDQIEGVIRNLVPNLGRVIIHIEPSEE